MIPRNPDSLEVELKMSIAETDARRIGRLPVLRAMTTGRATSRAMHSIYFDTADRALQQRQAALRLRREGTRWVQTLKFGGGVEGGLHTRHESEMRVAGPVLDARMFEHPALAPILRGADAGTTLTPVFTADFRRTTRLLALDDETRVEFCVDVGTIVAGARIEPICEIELELKSGNAATLLDFADALLQQIPATLESTSKAQRGYALAFGYTPSPVRASTPRLQQSGGLEQAYREIVFSCVQQLQANERGAIVGGDAEYLHQARVALRRLRSALSVFDAAFPRASQAGIVEELRWLGRCLGPARDWDVFALVTLPHLLRAFPRDPGLMALERRTAELRGQAGLIAREALCSTRYTRLLLRLIGLFLRRPWEALDDAQSTAVRALSVTQFAEQMLMRRHRKAIKRGRRHAQLDRAALHALRIEVKKLRYAAEFVGSLYERKAVRRYVDALAGLQEVLGGLNDAATVDCLCQELRTAAAHEDVGESLGMLRGWSSALAEDHLSALPKAWKRFRDAERFW